MTESTGKGDDRDGKECRGEAIEEIIERHLAWLQAFARRKLTPFLRAKAETGDIVQDALVQFLRYGPRLVVDSETRLRALLSRIVENVIRDKYDWFTARRRALARERPLPADTVLHLSAGVGGVETPSRVAHRNEQEAWVRLGLELLGPDDRTVLILRDWDRLTFREIGNRQSLSEHKARRHYIRSLGLLARTVKHLRAGKIDDAILGGRNGEDGDR